MAKQYFEMAAEVDALRAEYHEKVTGGDITLKEAQDLSARIKELSIQMSDTLTKGANGCPTCGEKPHGMKRGKGRIEIGCLPCPNQRSEADTKEEAVFNWNAGTLSLPRVADLKRCNKCLNINLSFDGPPKTKGFVVTCLGCQGVEVKGNTAGEAIDNWNNSIFADADTPPALPIGKAVKETAGG